MSKEKKVTVEFRDLTFERLLAKSWPAGTRVDSVPSRALGVMWRLMVWPTGSTPGNSVQVALMLAEPERTITPERVIMSFPGLKASTSCKLATFSSAAKPPPGLDTRVLSVVIPFDEFRSPAQIALMRAPHAGQLTGTRFLTVRVAMQAGKAGAAAAASAEAWSIPKSSALCVQLCTLSETMDGADVSVAVDAADDEAAAAEAPLKVHSFMLLLRCGARAALGTMAAPGPRIPPFTLIAPQRVGAEAMKAFVQFVYTDTLPPSLPHATLCELLIAANYFDVPMLLAKCEQQLVAALSPSNMVATLQLADQHARTLLRTEALRYVAANLGGDVTLSPEWAALPQELSSAAIQTALNDGEPPELRMLPRAAPRPREDDDAGEAGSAPKRSRDGS